MEARKHSAASGLPIGWLDLLLPGDCPGVVMVNRPRWCLIHKKRKARFWRRSVIEKDAIYGMCEHCYIKFYKNTVTRGLILAEKKS